MKISLLLPCVASCIIFSQAYASPSLDVGGIRIGSTSSEARTAIMAMNPKLTLSDLKQNNGEIAGIEGREKISIGMEPAGARSMKPGATVEKFLQKDHVVILFDKKGIVWFVGRTQGYVPGTPRPTYAATWSALEEKFGEPSIKSGSLPIGSGEWEFDRSGKLFSRKGNLVSAKGPCTRAGRGTDFAAGPEGYYSINAPETFSSTCGFRVDAKIDASKSSYDKNDEGLVKFFNLTIYDSARMYEELKKAQETNKAAAARAKEAEFEKSKEIKPKL